MAEISSDTTKFQSVYVALWELLNSGIATQDWFWYGEVGLYGDGGGEKWQPLLLRRIRRPKGTVQMPHSDFASPCGVFTPSFYPGFLEATNGTNVLSVLRAIHGQFDRQERNEAPLPVFAALNSDEETASAELQNCLIHRTKMMEKLVQGRYRLLFSNKNLEDMEKNAKVCDKQPAECVRQYAEYIKTIVNGDFRKEEDGKQENGKQHIARRFYPTHAWLFGLPIYTIQRGRPLLLAIFIVIAEGVDFSCDDRATFKSCQKCLQNIERYLVPLEIEATHVLSHTFFRLIDGYVPGSDPIALLAHPGLSKVSFLDALRMEGSLHSNDVQFSVVYNLPGSIYRRVFERSAETPAKLLLPLKGSLEELTISEKRRWLKALYGHKRARAHIPHEPGTHKDYRYNPKQLIRLAYLLSLLEPADSSRAHRPSVSVFVYPKDKKADENNTFHWPVEPGVRFLLPWLKAVSGIAREVGCVAMKILIVPGSSAHWRDFRKADLVGVRRKDAFNSAVIEQWADLRRQDEPRPSGLIVSFDGTGDEMTEVALKQRVQGWTRALIDPYRRRGEDTTLIQNLLLGNIGDVLTEEGLSFPGSDPLFLPLTASLPVKADFMTAGRELLMAVTW